MNRYGDIDWSFKRLAPVYGFHSQELVSIEKALEPIKTQIKELSVYVKIAENHCNYPNKHGLSKDQSASVYIYTMEWGPTSLYHILNQTLRSEDRNLLKIWFPYLKLFDTALDLLPTHNGAIWRGVSLDIGKNFTKNQMFTWWSISSCSSSVNVIEKFLGKNKQSTLFLIEAMNGKRVAGYTAYEKEDEIILKMGTKFRVQGDAFKKSNNLVLVHLIEINDEDQQLPPSPFYVLPKLLKSNLKWRQYAMTIAGGKGEGDQLNQLSRPYGICVDDEEKAIYIADCDNHRIVKCKFGTNNGQVVAGGNGKGDRIDQLSLPTDVIVDPKTKDLIICDYGNSRVVRRSMENPQDRQIIISDIKCSRLAMNDNGDLFVCCHEKHEVRRWKKDEKEGTVIAGGNSCGDRLNQFNVPTSIFIDRYAVYISDRGNHRVMKWEKGAKEGIIVAGGQGQGHSLNQLSYPRGIIVNEVGDVYVADCFNHRIMCWSSGSKEGSVVLGGNGRGKESNQFNYPKGLSFDDENNLYVVDCDNHRIQRFYVDYS